MRTILQIFFVLLFALPALADWEEYSFSSDSEVKEINSSLLIDSEYFSDILTYQLPLSMESAFRHQDKILSLSIGSLSGKRFSTLQKLKLDTQLNDKLLFRFVYFESKNLEQSLQHAILELQYKLTQSLDLIGYTELMSEKKFNDVGFGVLGHFSEKHSLRLFLTAVDFSFNQRTEDKERDQGSSYAYGLIGRWLGNSDDEFFEYYARSQSPLQRRDFNTSTSYQFGETKIGLRGRFEFLEDQNYFNFDVSYKNRNEGLSPIADEELNLWKNEHWDMLAQYENSQWVAGVSTYLRSWNLQQDIVRARSVLPHVWYKVLSNDREHLRFGYEVTWFHESGPALLRKAIEPANEFEHRGNIRYTIHFNKTAFLHLLFTADLDKFTWEGGNGQLQIVF